MQEEVSVHAHVIQRVHARVEQVARPQLEHDAPARQHRDEVGHDARTSVQPAVKPVMFLLVQSVVDEDRVLFLRSGLGLDELVEEKVCIAQVEQKECLVFAKKTIRVRL